VYVVHFLAQKFLTIPVLKFKGVDNFSSKIHTETKNRPIPIVRNIGEIKEQSAVSS